MPLEGVALLVVLAVEGGRPATAAAAMQAMASQCGGRRAGSAGPGGPLGHGRLLAPKGASVTSPGSQPPPPYISPPCPALGKRAEKAPFGPNSKGAPSASPTAEQIARAHPDEHIRGWAAGCQR